LEAPVHASLGSLAGRARRTRHAELPEQTSALLLGEHFKPPRLIRGAATDGGCEATEVACHALGLHPGDRRGMTTERELYALPAGSHIQADLQRVILAA